MHETSAPESPVEARAPSRAYDVPASGRAVAWNMVLNLGGQGAPLLVAAFAIPALVAQLGAERFGMLSIVWIFLGYFSLFDLGMSRALTQLLAERLGTHDQAELGTLAWTALALTLGLGLCGGLLTVVLTPLLVYRVLSLPAALQGESVNAFFALAAAVPVVLCTASLRGILEAVNRFDVVNAIRLPLGVFTFLGPLLVLPFSNSIFGIVLVLIGGRLLACAAHVVYCRRALPGLGQAFRFERRFVRQLLRFGGWMTVSNLISPLMVYMDRFLIGAVLSVTAVAYYSAPWEVVTRLLIIPGAFTTVLFPLFSFLHYRHTAETSRLYLLGLKGILLTLTPLVLLVIVFARAGLTWWLGPEYAEAGFRPMQVLALGVLLNGLAGVPFALVQGNGRADLTAKLHLVELCFYVPVLWWLMGTMGITGVALAWLLRVGLDLVLLALTAWSLQPVRKGAFRRLVLGTGATFGLLGGAMLPGTASGQVLFLAAGLSGFGLLAWRYLFTPEEAVSLRQLLRDALRKARPAGSPL
jgi:O-antigen/teichoic acid export membrane protein